jgi:hypothetical protein
MAMGKSRRIVVDVDDVDLKRRLYAALVHDGLSLKDWFVASATNYLSSRDKYRQMDLPVLRVAEAPAPYGTTATKEEP